MGETIMPGQEGDVASPFSPPKETPSPLAPRARATHLGNELVDMEHAEGMLWFHKQLIYRYAKSGDIQQRAGIN